MSNAYLIGRVFACEHPDTPPPCSSFLEEAFRFTACDRHHLLNGFVKERSKWAAAVAVDPRRRECRCRRGCNQELLFLLGLA